MKEVIPHYISKIEGHGSLKIDFTENQVEMHIHEGERLFEGMMLGRKYEDAVFIPQRICGVCPTAHCMGSIKAIENAIEIKATETSQSLRRLMLCGQMIQSHALHLFFLALPDYIGLDTTLSLVEAEPETFQIALNLKKYGDKIVELIGGRPVHPITPTVGGFSQKPEVEAIEQILNESMLVLDDAKKSLNLWGGLKYPPLMTEPIYMAIQGVKDYSFYHGGIASSNGDVFPVEDYMRDIEESSRNYSTAKFSSHHERSFMVGALARANLQGDYLNKQTRELMVDLGIAFPSQNPYHNNLAQAVELMHFVEQAAMEAEELLDKGMGEVKQEIEIHAGSGYAAVEAPRGTLYYHYSLDDDGKLTQCDIITPTAQNLHNLEEDAEALLMEYGEKDPEELKIMLNMLVRAYDPCITCSVH